jgi:hypothetical protein
LPASLTLNPFPFLRASAKLSGCPTSRRKRFLCTHSNARNPFLQYGLLHNSLDTRGWGVGSLAKAAFPVAIAQALYLPLLDGH